MAIAPDGTLVVVELKRDQTEAMSMADTIVLMKDGRIQQVGSPEDQYSKPNNTFVAEFVGAPPMLTKNGWAVFTRLWWPMV